MQIFVDGLLEQCRSLEIPAELILVEWNPPDDRPRLAEALRWPEPGPCAVRIIEVPGAIHNRYAHPGALPLYQMIAKNAGIRRARGEFILATNVDLLFSRELMQFLAGRRLEHGSMYRIDRCDVMAGVPDAPVDEQLAWCRSHMLRVHAAAGVSSVKPDGSFTLETEDIADRRSGIALGAGWFAREMRGRAPFRWFDNDAEIRIESHPKNILAIDIAAGPGVREEATALDIFDDAGERLYGARIGGRTVIHVQLPRTPIRLRLHIDGGGSRIEGEPRALNMCVRRLALVNSATPWKALRRVYWTPRRKLGRMIYPAMRYADVVPDSLHLAACGDFTLMARQHWLDLRGYPEFDMFPMNLDSVLCWAAHYGGARQRVLQPPMRLYHIEHETGSGWTPEGQAKLFRRLKENGVPWLDQSEMLRWGFEMCRANAPKLFNGEDWGLAEEDLEETLVQSPATETLVQRPA